MLAGKQAIKALVLAIEYLKNASSDVSYVPAFADGTIEDKVRKQVERRYGNGRFPA